MAIVKAVCISEKKGTVKTAVPEIELRASHGIDGDAHAGNWHRQVSLLGVESVERMRASLSAAPPGLLPGASQAAPQELPPGASHTAPHELPPGAFAENILTEGLTLYALPVGTRLRVGGALLEITQIGKECHADCEIRKLTGDCVMPREGVFAIVLEGARVRAGDAVALVSYG